MRRYPTKQDRKATWMQAYEQRILVDRPEQSGRLDWDTATFFFNSGLSPEEAAVKTLARICGD